MVLGLGNAVSQHLIDPELNSAKHLASSTGQEKLNSIEECSTMSLQWNTSKQPAITCTLFHTLIREADRTFKGGLLDPEHPNFNYPVWQAHRSIEKPSKDTVVVSGPHPEAAVFQKHWAKKRTGFDQLVVTAHSKPKASKTLSFSHDVP